MRQKIGTLSIALLLGLTGCGPAGDDSEDGSDSREEIQVEGVETVRSSKKRIKNPQVSGDKAEELAADNAAFAFDLYEELASEKSGENFFYSPHSLSSALAMTYAGAESSSEKQMKNALHFELAESELHPAFNQLDLLLEKRAKQAGKQNKGSPFELEVANAVWGQQEYPFKEPFLDTLAQHYGAGLQAVDFQNDPKAAREAINEWVRKATEDRIEKLLSKGSIDALTRMILTNAIYFNASWKHKFDKSNTAEAEFTTASGSKVQVDMMKQTQFKGFRHADGSNWEAVGLPYVGEKVSMVVVVPDKGSFSAVEQKLSKGWAQQLFANLKPTPVELAMPRFEFESRFSAKQMLTSLGMETPFRPEEANFTDIADVEQLYISDVVHQSFIAVDERGTEAAAASAVKVAAGGGGRLTEVTVDRPFIFMIRDRDTNTVIFAGRVLDPT